MYNECGCMKEGLMQAANAPCFPSRCRLGLGVAIYTRPEELPLLCQWKSWVAGDYVMGIEPCDCYGDGRAKHMQRGELEMIPVYGKKTVHIQVGILDRDGIARLERVRQS